MEVIFHIFYYYWGNENRALYRGLCYIEVRYIKVPLYKALRNGWPTNCPDEQVFNLREFTAHPSHPKANNLCERLLSEFLWVLK